MSSVDGAAGDAVNDPQGDVIEILLEQHVRIRELFARVRSADGERRQQAFDELRALLAVHETGEEMVLRPVSRRHAGAEVADARNKEEDAATRLLADLEKRDVSSAQFDTGFAELEAAVLDHAGHEEREEFPHVRAREERDSLMSMGRALRAAEQVAPTHPHPTAGGSPMMQWAVGPFASLVDRARDEVKRATPGS